MTDPRLQTLRDYLGMASGGTKTDAELWEFAQEALSDMDELTAHPTASDPST